MQTIEREPPSLKSYPDDRQPGGDVFGRNFKEVIRRFSVAVIPGYFFPFSARGCKMDVEIHRGFVWSDFSR